MSKESSSLQAEDIETASSNSIQWTPREEKVVVLKTDVSVLLLLTLGLMVFQFDRMNLASALTGGFQKDVPVTQNEINIGNELMFLGIFLFEIPSNILLMKLGPVKWLPTQIFFFGLVAIMQIFLHNKPGFYASRFILGVAESGYIPGGCYIMSNWYKPNERARRTSIYFFGMFGGYAISPILCSAILLLSGRHGIAGWRWIFLIEGLLTLLVAFLMLLLLPESPRNSRPLLKKFSLFTERERFIISNRLKGSENTDEQLHPITKQHLVKALTAYKRYPHFIATSLVFGTWAPLTTYTPTILVKVGFTRVAANALTAVGGSLAVLVVFLFGVLSDLTNKRGLSTIIATFIYGVVLIIFNKVIPQVYPDKWHVFALYCVVNAFAVGYHPQQNTWLQLNSETPQERSISLAMWVMSAMIGLMSGSQLFRSEDAPLYKKGSLAMIVMVFVGGGFSVLQWLIYYRDVRSGRRQWAL